MVRVEKTANDVQLWGDQVCVWGGWACFCPLGLEGQEGPPKQQDQATCSLEVGA